MNTLKINHLAVWACVVLLHIIGFLWYGPLFGEAWMGMVGLDPEMAEGGASDAGLWITDLISTVAPLYLLAWLFTKLNVTSGAHGAAIAFLAALCFHHLPLMAANMFSGEPYGLAWITGGYSVVAWSLSGFIIGSWTKKTETAR
jgi:hypothetical protein